MKANYCCLHSSTSSFLHVLHLGLQRREHGRGKKKKPRSVCLEICKSSSIHWLNCLLAPLQQRTIFLYIWADVNKSDCQMYLMLVCLSWHKMFNFIFIQTEWHSNIINILYLYWTRSYSVLFIWLLITPTCPYTPRPPKKNKSTFVHVEMN